MPIRLANSARRWRRASRLDESYGSWGTAAAPVTRNTSQLNSSIPLSKSGKHYLPLTWLARFRWLPPFPTTRILRVYSSTRLSYGDRKTTWLWQSPPVDSRPTLYMRWNRRERKPCSPLLSQAKTAGAWQMWPSTALSCPASAFIAFRNLMSRCCTYSGTLRMSPWARRTLSNERNQSHGRGDSHRDEARTQYSSSWRILSAANF